MSQLFPWERTPVFQIAPDFGKINGLGPAVPLINDTTHPLDSNMGSLEVFVLL